MSFSTSSAMPCDWTSGSSVSLDCEPLEADVNTTGTGTWQTKTYTSLKCPASRNGISDIVKHHTGTTYRNGHRHGNRRVLGVHVHGHRYEDWHRDGKKHHFHLLLVYSGGERTPREACGHRELKLGLNLNINYQHVLLTSGRRQDSKLACPRPGC